MMYSLYFHIAPNGKMYIGITRRKPELRWKKGSGYLNNNHFYNAIKKYGWNNIKHIVVYDNLTQKEAEEKEVELIAKYKTNNRLYGYNNDNGGKTKGVHSEATRRKLSLSHLGKPGRKNMSNEEKEIHRQNVYNRWHTEEGRKKILNGIRKNHGVKVICVETGKVFDTIIDASNYYNISRHHIGKCCLGKQKTCGGYHWKRWGK